MEDLSKLKKQILEHIIYEIEMYLSTLIYKIDDFYATNEKKVILKNYMLEAKLTHLRNLIHFFANEPTRTGKSSDILYHNIVEKSKNLGELISDQNTILKHIDKSASHLTKERIEQDWDKGTQEAANSAEKEIIKKIKIFMETIDAGKVEEKYLGEISDPDINKRIRCVIDMFSIYDEQRKINSGGGASVSQNLSTQKDTTASFTISRVQLL